jgi:Ca-activated chloride channel family protein
MNKLFKYLKRINNKPLLFGMYGALGCLIAALLFGELFLFLMAPPPITQPSAQALVLLIDSSGSMDGAKLAEVKTAATNFVQRQNLSQNQIAIIGFGSDIHLGTPLTNDVATLTKAIANLADGGGTRMDMAIESAVQELQSTSLAKNILLFTDGQPGFSGSNLPEEIDNTLQAGKRAKAAQINLIAVATGDADTNFLGQLTQNPNLVFYADSGNFDKAFQSAEKAIYSLIDSSSATSSNPFLESVAITGVWTSILAIGASLALIIGQNHFLRRRLFNPKEIALGIMGGLLAGFMAGAIAQLGFSVLSQFPTLAIGGRLVAWSFLGILVGGGMSLFVPNLKLSKAILGGFSGGTIGGLGFLLASSFFGVTVGRLIGAMSLGFFLGLMIALLEQITRQAWVVVHWTLKEQTTISLGSTPIILGSSPNAHIYLRKDQDYPSVTAKIYLQGEKIYLEFDDQYIKQKSMKKLKQELKNGDIRKLDRISIEVRTTFTNLQSV